MSKGETFPNIHGQLDVTGLNFQLLDAASCFSVCLPLSRIALRNPFLICFICNSVEMKPSHCICTVFLSFTKKYL